MYSSYALLAPLTGSLGRTNSLDLHKALFSDSKSPFQTYKIIACSQLTYRAPATRQEKKKIPLEGYLLIFVPRH